MKQYDNLEDIIEQLELCNFTDKMGHPLENNLAFVKLKEMANKNK